jgi:hypothetical protein
LVESEVDEIRAAIFDGKPIEAYWAWKERHCRSDRFPHGESLDAAMLRYADALHRLLERTKTTRVNAHELAVRWIANAETQIAHAVPHLLDEHAHSPRGRPPHGASGGVNDAVISRHGSHRRPDGRSRRRDLALHLGVTTPLSA